MQSTRFANAGEVGGENGKDWLHLGRGSTKSNEKHNVGGANCICIRCDRQPRPYLIRSTDTL